MWGRTHLDSVTEKSPPSPLTLERSSRRGNEADGLVQEGPSLDEPQGRARSDAPYLPVRFIAARPGAAPQCSPHVGYEHAVHGDDGSLPPTITKRHVLLHVVPWLFVLLFHTTIPVLQAQQPANPRTSTNLPPIVLTVEGTNVSIQRFSSKSWEAAVPNQVLAPKDRGRTGVRSRASVRLSDLSILRIAELSEFEIQPLADPKAEAEFSLFRGLLYLLNRDRPGRHRFVTPTATAATRGTEFTLEVEEATGRTTLAVLEGEAELSNAAGSLTIAPGEQGVALLGQKPTKTAILSTARLVQWCLYYPGVLDLEDLSLTTAEQQELQPSIDAYRTGDLLSAVSAYPPTRPAGSDQEKVFAAALHLSVGQAAQADSLLNSLSVLTATNASVHRLADSLRVVINTVSPHPPRNTEYGIRNTPLLSPTELLARSYAEQSALRLEDALLSARLAVRKSPKFAFAWTRIAELEFSRGRTKPALEALERSLTLAPRNAQAIALKGFLLSAQNNLRDALPLFDQAIQLDGGLGNAWLGRGLAKIRLGRAAEGRFDLHAAAVTEPQRSLLRSYLGKAWSNEGDVKHAEKELRLARELDAGDPTPWLYSALLLQQQNRINEGIRDLETARALSDNRALYRSRLLLDQDRAVSGANLANLYQDAGLAETSAREAGRAVNADYANHSAHRFLADSFNALRDPNGFNQRYESAWFTEYLLANLLSPVGAGGLSQTVSQQEYAKLFERDRFGIASSSSFASHGAWGQQAVQYGTWGDSSYAAEFSYRTDDGWRANNDFERITGLIEFKHQITPQDGVYFQANYSATESGDLTHYYHQSQAQRHLRLEEQYEPLLLAGYHHEWSPGSHTLLLASRTQVSQHGINPDSATLFFYHGLGGPIRTVAPLRYDQDYQNELESYAAEAQQLFQHGDHTLILGGRIQTGEFDTHNRQTGGRVYNDTGSGPISFNIAQNIQSGFERRSAYAYDQWQFWPTLLLSVGVSYDWLYLPDNYRAAPVSNGHDTRDQLSPKAGFIFTPATNTTLRGAWFRALGGVSLDQSVRLEPSQVAGFNQAYRSVIPNSVASANDGAEFEGWNGSVEQKFGRGTFLGVSGEILSSKVTRRIGAVDLTFPTTPGSPYSTSQTRQELDYRERTLAVTLDQLLGNGWSFGARYSVSKADYESRYPQIPATAGEVGGFEREQNLEAVLHQLSLRALYNHPSGFFGHGWGLWSVQSNQGYTIDIPGDNFWQFNLQAGWRFLRRRAEVSVALLNLTDQDYRLNPLNLTSQLPRDREVVVSLRLNF